jgi:hypothetical protein
MLISRMLAAIPAKPTNLHKQHWWPAVQNYDIPGL